MTSEQQADGHGVPDAGASPKTLEGNIMFIRGTSASLPGLSQLGIRKPQPQRTGSAYGLISESSSRAGLPTVLSSYSSVYDIHGHRMSRSQTGLPSEGAARRRNKLAAQRALGLATPSSKPHQRRNKTTNSNLSSGEPMRLPSMRSPSPSPSPSCSPTMKLKAGMNTIKSSLALKKGKTSLYSTGDLIDSVEDLIDDAVLKEDEMVVKSKNERITNKIVSLPVLVCFGSSNVVLMDTKPTAAVLRQKRIDELDGGLANPKRVMSPAALERLPIPSHWPGEPEWLRQRAVEQVTDSESDEEPTQTMPPVSTPKSALQRKRIAKRKSFKKTEFSNETKKLTFAKTMSKGPLTSRQSRLQSNAQPQPEDGLDMSIKAKQRQQYLKRWKTPKNLLLQEAEETVEEMSVFEGKGEHGEVHEDEAGGFTDYENEDEEAREERWAAELTRFDELADALDVHDHEDYCYSGSFGKPTTQFAEQHRFVRHLMRYNPAAFDAEAAKIQEQAFFLELDKTKRIASEAINKSGEKALSRPQFVRQLKDLSSTRPILVWPDLHRIKRGKAQKRTRDRQGQAKEWEFANSVFAARYFDYTSSFIDIVEDHLLFDWNSQSNSFYNRFTKQPVPSRNHPSCKSHLDRVARDLQKTEAYAPMCQAFYSYAASDPLTPEDKPFYLSFEGFLTACQAWGILLIVDREIQAGMSDGNIPEEFMKDGLKVQVMEGDVEEQDQKAEADDSSPSEGASQKGGSPPEVDVEIWKASMLAKLFRPSQTNTDTCRAHELDVDLEDLTFQEIRKLQTTSKDTSPVLQPKLKAEVPRPEPINRLEWMDCCFAVARLKYIDRDQRFRGKDPMTQDPMEAIKFFVERDLCKTLPASVFRDVEDLRGRLYTAPIDSVLRRNHEFIKAMFELYKARDKATRMTLNHWLDMLRDLKIIGERLDVSELEARLLFVHATTGVAAPAAENIRNPTLSIYDFLEALARLAEAVHLPRPEDITSGYKTENVKKDADAGFHLCDFVLTAPVKALIRKRQSSSGSGTRLPDKLERLFDYMTGALCRYWDLGKCCKDELASHLQAIRVTIWRWGCQTQASFRSNKSMLTDDEGDSSDEDKEGF